MTEQEERYIKEQEGKALGLKSNILGQHSTTTTTSVAPKTTTRTYTKYEDDAYKYAQEQSDAVMSAGGHKKNEQGEYQPNDHHLSSVLDMTKHNEDIYRVNKAKKLNAGIVDAVGVISDIISAAGGGSVYKREANTIAEDAAKDTQARKEAERVAIANAKEKDRQALQDSLKLAREAYNKGLELKGVKVSENSGGRTINSSSTTKSPDAVKTAPMVVMNADGTSSILYVDKAKVETYRTNAWNSLMRMSLLNNPVLDKYAFEKGYTTDGGAWKTSLKDTILNDPTIIAMLPAAIQQMNRELRYDSEEYASMIYGDDYRNLSKQEKVKRLREIENLVYGTQGASSGASGQRSARGAITPQDFSAYNLLTGQQLSGNTNGSQYF